jgi:hypothetical protein
MIFLQVHLQLHLLQLVFHLQVEQSEALKALWVLFKFLAM